MFCLRNTCLYCLLETPVICSFWEQMHRFETKEEKETRFGKKTTIYCEEKWKNFISIITFLQNIFIEPGEFSARTWANVMARVLVSSPHLLSWASVPNIKQSNCTGWLLRWVLFLGTSGNSHFKKSYLHRHIDTAPTRVHKPWLLLGSLVLPVWSVTCWKFSSTETL